MKQLFAGARLVAGERRVAAALARRRVVAAARRILIQRKEMRNCRALLESGLLSREAISSKQLFLANGAGSEPTVWQDLIEGDQGKGIHNPSFAANVIKASLAKDLSFCSRSALRSLRRSRHPVRPGKRHAVQRADSRTFQP